MSVERVKVYFGGSYQEHWSDDYTLAVHYQDRRWVEAENLNGRWAPVDGDRALCELLRSADCPALTRQYFQTVASVYAAALHCAHLRLPLEHLAEYADFGTQPLAAPELLRLLMDDAGFPLEDAWQTVASCCEDLFAKGVEEEALYALQPRTAHVMQLLRQYAAEHVAAQHDSAELRYRTPLGAVPEGSELELSVELRSGAVRSAVLELYGDDLSKELPMDKTEHGYSIRVTPPGPEALWYRFRLETATETVWLCPDRSGHCGRLYPAAADGFRLTVYCRDFETPAWFHRSVMYQIFPDRFAFSDDGTAERGVAYHRALGQTAELHQSRREPVRWQPRPFEQDYMPDDFYGGTLKGIETKLPYLKNLGISCLYLNPIVEARSNHRYDTADYLKVDPILGDNEDLKRLCRRAEELGMRVILDGVFSHTGADSLYFNRYGHYPSVGAYQGSASPYYPWYEFRSFPDDYRCWWGFSELPEVEELDPAWQDFVVTGEHSVVRTWLRRGAAGWRLDVADELPDEVLSLIRRASKEEKPDAVVLGEVWEDAVIKESYGGRRNYALGWSLDTVMNYPLRAAILDFLHGRMDAWELRDFLISQQMNYPKPMYYSLMNLLGSHDVERLRSALATDVSIKELSREEQLQLHFSDEALAHALTLERLGAAIQFSLPGVPSIYYGDEQGMCGVGDPFNRQPFTLGDRRLHDWYASLSAQRNGAPALSTGEAKFMAASADVLLILRWIEGGKDVFGLPADNGAYLTVINRGAAADFAADCSAAGFGLYRGHIESESARTIEL